MKNKKSIILAGIVLLLGIGVIFGIKTMHDKGLFEKAINRGEHHYSCVLENSETKETETFNITYLNGKPQEIVDTLLIPYEEGVDSEELFQRAIYGIEEFNDRAGFKGYVESVDNGVKRVIAINYGATKSEVTGLYAGNYETWDKYLTRLEEHGYTCESK